VDPRPRARGKGPVQAAAVHEPAGQSNPELQPYFRAVILANEYQRMVKAGWDRLV